MNPQLLSSIAQGIGLTLYVTGASLLIGGLIGLVLVGAARSPIGIIRTIANVYINVVRVIPPITWLFLIYFGLPQFALRLTTIQAAIIGFSIIASAFMAEIYRSGLLSIPVGQREAAHALGLSSITTVGHIITPQAFRVALPAIATYGIGLLKDSALASTIGVREITYYAQQSAKQTNEGLQAFVVAGVLYILISLVVALISRRVDLTLRRKIGVA
ncbi:amino acid ABC transporter permease [Paenarthrobacter sp. A20]|uniref:amino acid ABC transporter permease n=1 Tax=Paenarthrobacter sp. A20 TaxID=2817891 RepID=UPI00209D8C34|nr:amino acid ABC transporter permease [Paenarthrobacter sp. A20]MCP1415540.1 polar amino acid transport system permease protein [Paenarthrobacter sp. A20]